MKELDHDDWRTEILQYQRDPSSVSGRRVWRQALKYVNMNDELYQRTMEGLLLKCLGEEQACLAMGEVHKGLCGTHQSAYNMK
jgi:hypothetical protein